MNVPKRAFLLFVNHWEENTFPCHHFFPWTWVSRKLSLSPQCGSSLPENSPMLTFHQLVKLAFYTDTTSSLHIPDSTEKTSLGIAHIIPFSKGLLSSFPGEMMPSPALCPILPACLVWCKSYPNAAQALKNE